MRRCLIALAASLALLCSASAAAFDVRALHIDMRNEVMTIGALKSLADKAAAGGINTIIMEWEASFPYKDNAVICNDEVFTEDEVRDFVSHCSSLGIDVIPLQNCFGHCEYILRHERYAALREAKRDFSQVCPSEEWLAKETFRSIFKDIIRLHPSKYIHIGADETRLLGVCPKCAAKVEKEGTSKLFCDYVIAMCEVAKSLGKTPIIWADILTKHPEAAGNLPKDLILLDWNYGWSLDRFGSFQRLVDHGLPMWGASALRSGPDDLHLVQWMKHFGNLRDYVWNVRQMGFKGIVETSWSTSGEYGYTWAVPIEATDLHPTRQVYPLAGFDILQQAFFEAASSDRQFQPEEFIRRYCASKFGFGTAEQDVMMEYFSLPQTLFRAKEKARLESEYQATLKVQEKLRGLHPKSGRTEFAHLKLMLDIRENYLAFMRCYVDWQDPSFDASRKASLAARVKPVLERARKLQKEFCSLNKDYLKHPERAFGSESYLRRLQYMYDCLRGGGD